jgi:hypothetical protein
MSGDGHDVALVPITSMTLQVLMTSSSRRITPCKAGPVSGPCRCATCSAHRYRRDTAEKPCSNRAETPAMSGCPAGCKPAGRISWPHGRMYRHGLLPGQRHNARVVIDGGARGEQDGETLASLAMVAPGYSKAAETYFPCRTAKGPARGIPGRVSWTSD